MPGKLALKSPSSAAKTEREGDREREIERGRHTHMGQALDHLHLCNYEIAIESDTFIHPSPGGRRLSTQWWRQCLTLGQGENCAWKRIAFGKLLTKSFGPAAAAAAAQLNLAKSRKGGRSDCSIDLCLELAAHVVRAHGSKG